MHNFIKQDSIYHAFVIPVVEHWLEQEGRKEMFYLMTHSTHFIYGYMASDIW